MLILLYSVGTTVDTETLDTYATFVDGRPDFTTDVPMRDCDPEWFKALSDEDFGTVEFLLINK